MAEELTKAVDLAKDPREAAHALARLEEGLKQPVQDELKKKEPASLAERLKPLEQRTESNPLTRGGSAIHATGR